MFTQKIKEPLSTRVSACLEASINYNLSLRVRPILPRFSCTTVFGEKFS